MARQFIQLKPSIPRSGKHSYLLSLLLRSNRLVFKPDSGLTLTELLVGTLISSIVLGVAFFGASLNRQLYLEDQGRNNVNQNLRVALDIVGNDIKQAGEGIGKDPNFPVILIDKTTDSSEIVIRRNLSDTILRLCQDLEKDTSSAVSVVDNGDDENPPLPGCSVVDDDKDGWPDGLKEWRDYRLTKGNGGKVRAFIYDGQGNGEFFNYNAEKTFDATDSEVTPTPPPSGGTTSVESGSLETDNTYTWKNNYQAGNGSRIYLLEERRYRLVKEPKDGYTLELVIDGNETVSITNNLQSFEVTAIVEQEEVDYFCSVISPTNTDCGDDSLPNSYAWSQIKAIKVKMQAFIDEQNKASIKRLDCNDLSDCKDLQLTRQFVPRNVFNF